MLVGMDARMINWSGIGRYTQNLITGINEFASDEIRFFLFHNEQDANNDLIRTYENKEMIDVPVFSLLAAKELAGKIGSKGLDLYHSPHFVLPAGLPPYPFVITIHDLIPLIVKETMTNILHRKWYYQLNKINCNKATRIIAPSKSTKQDIIRMFGVREDKIDVVYCAPDKMFRKVSNKDVEAMKEKYDIKEDYIFALGNQKPNKGLEFLIDAFSKLKREREIDQKLIISGTPDLKFNNVKRRITHNNIGEHVTFIGNVTDEDLIALYNGATVFVFPSLYEGFGLPPLEAMICETPVVSSSLSSIPEVVGDSALMVDPRQIDDLADAIQKLVFDREYAGTLVEKGLKHYKQFSLESFIANTKAVYNKAIKM